MLTKCMRLTLLPVSSFEHVKDFNEKWYTYHDGGNNYYAAICNLL